MKSSNKKSLIIVLFLSICFCVSAQEVFENTFYKNFTVEGKVFQLSIDKIDNNFQTLKLSDINSDEEASIKLLDPIPQDLFRLSLTNLLKDSLQIEGNSNDLSKKLDALYLTYFSWTILSNLPPTPVAGIFKILDSTVILEEQAISIAGHKVTKFNNKISKKIGPYTKKGQGLIRKKTKWQTIKNDLECKIYTKKPPIKFAPDSIDFEVFQGSIRKLFVYGKRMIPDNSDPNTISYLETYKRNCDLENKQGGLKIRFLTSKNDPQKKKSIIDSLYQIAEEIKTLSSKLEELKNILTYKSESIAFRSIHPIAISSIRDAQNFRYISLHSFDYRKVQNTSLIKLFL